jgi:hypothetical protein
MRGAGHAAAPKLAAPLRSAWFCRRSRLQEANPPGRCHCPVASARQIAHPIRPKQPVAFDREIAQPIGMQDFSPTDGEHVTGPRRSTPPIDSG